ncbi:MAG TPA: PTS cellobiose transporter subunit IIC [Lachnospiraceae bacterium]|jgi:putative flippase GtrA|nr:GtrA family protein [Lachnospiraceae bacterium]MDD6716040.1 GtrA family protein [Bacillota bacterium]HAK18264.1 PTS cellobiose transporter subunit IIC [Lachnospiraceae bacterium]HAP73622.1 PTS cellobiose transporter subunit IIC [Lachnospiraceae bacterium]HBH70795.1 PTS cellobiose transporter subunit IIC [Lachnospiraceae bacterium]
MLKNFTKEHPDLWQFIMFNLLSNISTITRFVLTWVGTALFVSAMQLTSPFKLAIFDYTTEGSHGLGGFLTFLVAEVMAQVVNFFVQKNWVFKSNADFGKSAPKYAVLAVLIVVVNLVLPGYVTNFCINTLGLGSGLAATIASVVNTLLAVVVSFPLLKFWIMPSDKPKQ